MRRAAFVVLLVVLLVASGCSVSSGIPWDDVDHDMAAINYEEYQDYVAGVDDAKSELGSLSESSDLLVSDLSQMGPGVTEEELAAVVGNYVVLDRDSYEAMRSAFDSLPDSPVTSDPGVLVP